MHWLDDDLSKQVEIAERWIDQNERLPPEQRLTPEQVILEKVLGEAYNRALKQCGGLPLPNSELQKVFRELYERARLVIDEGRG